MSNVRRDAEVLSSPFFAVWGTLFVLAWATTFFVVTANPWNTDQAWTFILVAGSLTAVLAIAGYLGATHGKLWADVIFPPIAWSAFVLMITQILMHMGRGDHRYMPVAWTAAIAGSATLMICTPLLKRLAQFEERQGKP